MPKVKDKAFDEALGVWARGHLKAELIDLDTGAVVQTEEGDNFISIIGIEMLKSQLRSMLNQFNVNQVTSANDPGDRGRPGRAPGFWPFWHLAYWNDATAEAPTTETHPRAPILGAALRINTGSVAGRRGLPSLSEGEASHESVTFVFEWVSANGNGTFQSVGWVSLPAYASSAAWNTSGAPIGMVPHPTATAANFAGSFLTLGSASSKGLHYETGGNYWTVVRNLTAYEIHSINVTTGVTTLVVAIPSTMASYNVAQASAYNITDIVRIGTDWYTSATTTSSTGSSRIGKMNAAGTQQFSVTHDGGASEVAAARYVMALATDGTNLYAGTALQAGTATPIIYQISTTTGLITATITPDAAAIAALGIASGITELAVDASYFYAVSGSGVLVKLDKATGALVGCGVALGATGETGTAAAPHGADGYATGGGTVQPASALIVGTNTSSNTANGTAAANATAQAVNGMVPGSASFALAVGGGLIVDSAGMFVMLGATSADAGASTAAGLYVAGHTDTDKLGASLGSRVLLDNPITKTSSHGLKLSYTIEY